MTKSLNSKAEGLDNFVCFSLYGAGLAMTRLYKPLLDPYGLTYPQYLVLTALSEMDGARVGDLGERLQLETNTLTPLIKRLEAAGLVSRQRDQADERVVRVALTDKGDDIISQAHACLPQQVLEATGLTAEELQDLNHKLKTLQTALAQA